MKAERCFRHQNVIKLVSAKVGYDYLENECTADVR